MHLLTARLALPAVLVLPATGAHWVVGFALAAVLFWIALRGAWLEAGRLATFVLFGGILVVGGGLVALGTVVPYLPVLVCAACAVAILAMALASLYVGGPRREISRG